MTSRQRKDEVERLNEQLRKINFSLRQQARAGTIYAPGLTYVPPTLSGSSAYPVASMPLATVKDVREYSEVSDYVRDSKPSAAVLESVEEEEPLVVPSSYAAAAAAKDASQEVQPVAATTITTMSMDDEEQSPEARQCLQALKEGKRRAPSPPP